MGRQTWGKGAWVKILWDAFAPVYKSNHTLLGEDMEYFLLY